MTHQIEVFARADAAIDLAKARDAAHTALDMRMLDIGRQINIALTEDGAVRALNRQHRGRDESTDVLSFPAAPLPDAMSDDPACLGDIIVDLPYALERARRVGVDPDDAVCLLIVHGVLHLLGFDHDTEANHQAMLRAQAKALKRLGIDARIVERYAAAGTSRE